MLTYKKLTVIVAVVLLGTPSISMASSFVVSLVQGKSPAEAVQIIAEQIDLLTGRVTSLEDNQAQLKAEVSQNKSDSELEIEQLKSENEELRNQLNQKADVVIPPDETPECLALKDQIRTLEAERDAQTEPLEKQQQELRVKLKPLELEKFQVISTNPPGVQYSSPNLNEHQRQDEEIAWHNKVLSEQQKALERVENQIEELETQIDILEQQQEPIREKYQQLLAPLYEQGSASRCIKG